MKVWLVVLLVVVGAMWLYTAQETHKKVLDTTPNDVRKTVESHVQVDDSGVRIKR